MTRIVDWVWFPIREVGRFIGRNAKRVAVTIAGFALVIVGLAMLVLPGPGILIVIAGLAILATEYVWAQRTLNYAKQKAQQAKDKVLRRSPPTPKDPPTDPGP